VTCRPVSQGAPHCTLSWITNFSLRFLPQPKGQCIASMQRNRYNYCFVYLMFSVFNNGYDEWSSNWIIRTICVPYYSHDSSENSLHCHCWSQIFNVLYISEGLLRSCIILLCLINFFSTLEGNLYVTVYDICIPP
jgi:hypothetical protein